MTTQNPENDAPTSRDRGIQPLDQRMEEAGIGNQDLVAASIEQLTHKQVQKARKGKQVSANIQMKIVRAFVTAAKIEVSREELFNYSE